MEYKPKEYWEKRLIDNFDLSGVGCYDLGVYYNKWIYKTRIKVVKKVIKNLSIDLSSSSIIDIGTGTGFYINFYRNMGCSSMTGVDITEISISNLKKKFPELHFYQGDISEDQLSIPGQFDIINVFDVLYHITDDDKFKFAIANIKRMCNKNAYIFITDNIYSSLKSGHVKFRNLKYYKEVLNENNIRILKFYPLLSLIIPSVTLTEIYRKNKIFRYCIKISLNIFVPFIYLIDKLFINFKSNSQLLICQAIN